MLKAIILEDEEDSSNLLTGFLKDYCPQIKLVAAVNSVESGLAAIYSHHPDVVFMDIELKGETCFDLLDKLGEIRFDIIFTTAHEAHAIKAFKLSAIDYLLKPINVQELQAAVDKVVKKGDQADLICMCKSHEYYSYLQ
jgi:two-component system LytT family response regulator